MVLRAKNTPWWRCLQNTGERSSKTCSNQNLEIIILKLNGVSGRFH